MDFVIFEIAKKLKEKGYPQIEKNTLAMYDEDGYISYLCSTLDAFYYDFDDFGEDNYVCPTISQVLKWLREEKKIAVNVEFIPFVWQYKIFDMSVEKRFEDCGLSFYITYKEAAIAGIEHILDNLI